MKITFVQITTEPTSATIVWETNLPTKAKVFIASDGVLTKTVHSESGLSTKHLATVTNLTGGVSYSYEIEAIADDSQAAKKQGKFETTTEQPLLQLQQDSSSPPPSITPPVIKDLRISANGSGSCSADGKCGLAVQYLEDGEPKRVIVTISANDEGKFTACDCDPLGVTLGPNLEGNPLTAYTYRGGYGGKQGASFTYYPTDADTVTTGVSCKDQNGGTFCEVDQTRFTREITITVGDFTETTAIDFFYVTPSPHWLTFGKRNTGITNNDTVPVLLKSITLEVESSLLTAKSDGYSVTKTLKLYQHDGTGQNLLVASVPLTLEVTSSSLGWTEKSVLLEVPLNLTIPASKKIIIAFDTAFEDLIDEIRSEDPQFGTGTTVSARLINVDSEPAMGWWEGVILADWN